MTWTGVALWPSSCHQTCADPPSTSDNRQTNDPLQRTWHVTGRTEPIWPKTPIIITMMIITKPCWFPLNPSEAFSSGAWVSHLEWIDVDCLFERVWVKSRHYNGLYPPLESKLSGTRAANTGVSSPHFRSGCVTRMRCRSDCDVIRRHWRLLILYKFDTRSDFFFTKMIMI